MGIEVFIADEQVVHPVDAGRWVRLAERVLEAEGVTGEAELSVLYVDETSISDLHKRFLGKDGPTDVLSFPIDGEPEESGRHPDSGGSGPGDRPEPDDLPMLLGDVVICPAVALRNAPEHAGTYDDELALLLVHGILHLLGMDHEDDDEAEIMEARERALLDRFHRRPGEPDTDMDGEAAPAPPTPPRLPPRSTADTIERLRRGEGPPDPPGAGDEP
jgi:probable rRNA maturation factor